METSIFVLPKAARIGNPENRLKEHSFHFLCALKGAGIMGFYSLPRSQDFQPCPAPFKAHFFGIMATKSKFTNTDFSLTPEDFAFAMELAKIGYVKILSHQVSLRDENYGKKTENHVIAITTYGEQKIEGLKLPENWCIQSLAANEAGLSIVFGINKPEKKP